MTIALISLSREDPETGLPLGLSQLCGSTVADQQLRAAQAMGAETFVLLCTNLPNELMQHSDRWRAQGLNIEIVRTGTELADLAIDGAQLVFIGDGIVPSDGLAEQLGAAGSSVFVVENDEQLKEFERIDLTHRWLGIGVFDRSHLAALKEIPDDWDIGSALLRTAVQGGTRRELVSAASLDAGLLANLNNRQRLDSYQQQLLSGGTENRGNVFQRFLMQPLRRWALPRIWQRPELGRYVGWGSLALAVLSLPLAWTGWTAPALLSVLASMIGANVINRVHDFGGLAADRPILHRIMAIFPAVALLVCTVQSSPDLSGNTLTLYGNIVILASLLGALYLAEKTPGFGKLEPLRPDSLMALVILAGTTLFGAFLPGLYTVTLMAVLMLVVNQSRSPENGGKQP